MKTPLTPYQIFWTVQVLKNGKVQVEHFSSMSRLYELFKPRAGSKTYIITDKQFGLTQVTCNGEDPKLQKPFSHSILVKEGSFKRRIPITTKQFNNPIIN